MEENNEILFEFDRTINESDLDVLVSFLELSGGGDSKSTELMPNKRSVKMAFEDYQTKEAFLEIRIFKYGNYLIRASSNSGYKTEEYDLDDCIIILKNIDQAEDKEIIKMYAENLEPENEIIEMSHYNSFKNVMKIVYKDKINKDRLFKRYMKRSTIRNHVIDVILAYKLKSIILRLEASSELKQNILKIIFSADSLFYEEILNDIFLISCNTDESLSEFTNMLSERGLKFEYCPNFSLIESISKGNEAENRYLDKNEISATNENEETIIEKPKETKNKMVKRNKASNKIDKPIFSIIQPKFDYENLVTEDQNGEFIFKKDEPLTTGLLGSEKLCNDLSLRLSNSKTAQLVKPTPGTIKFKLIKSDSQSELIKELKYYYMNNFSAIIFEIPETFRLNPDILAEFNKYFDENFISKKKDNFYFIIENFEIKGYGSPKVLSKKVDLLRIYLSQENLNKIEKYLFKKLEEKVLDQAFSQNQYLAPVSSEKLADTRSHRLVISQNDNEYYLNVENPFVYCLLKSKHFLKNLNSNLQHLNGECVVKCDTLTPLVIVRHKGLQKRKNLKMKLLIELENFLNEHFFRKILKISSKLKEQQNIFNEFDEYLKSMEKIEPNGYVMITGDFIFCYGLKEFIEDKFKQISFVLNGLSEKYEKNSTLVNFGHQIPNEVNYFLKQKKDFIKLKD